MKTRIQPNLARLAGACLLVLLTLSASAQRSEVLPAPSADPTPGQLLPLEPPVALHTRLDELRVDVDFETS